MPLKPKFQESIVKIEVQKKSSNVQIPFDRSVAFEHKRNLTDAALFMGRSFRVGWGPNGTLIHSGFPVGKVLPTHKFVLMLL
jgi:nuclear pore complex protein Nup98-Nup96